MRKSVFLLSLFCMHTLCGAIQHRWQCDTSTISEESITAYRGETVEMTCNMTSYGRVIPSYGGEALLYWQTNGMNNAWWVTNAFFSSGTIRANWTPMMDVGNDSYRFFFQVTDLKGVNYRANGNIAILGSPYGDVRYLPLPAKIIDFKDVAVLNPTNAPWEMKGGGGREQVQSDWAETDALSKAFIKNKPNISAVAQAVTNNQQTISAVAQAVTNNQQTISAVAQAVTNNQQTISAVAQVVTNNSTAIEVLESKIGTSSGKVKSKSGAQIYSEYGNDDNDSFIHVNDLEHIIVGGNVDEDTKSVLFGETIGNKIVQLSKQHVNDFDARFAVYTNREEITSGMIDIITDGEKDSFYIRRDDNGKFFESEVYLSPSFGRTNLWFSTDNYDSTKASFRIFNTRSKNCWIGINSNKSYRVGIRQVDGGSVSIDLNELPSVENELSVALQMEVDSSQFKNWYEIDVEGDSDSGFVLINGKKFAFTNGAIPVYAICSNECISGSVNIIVYGNNITNITMCSARSSQSSDVVLESDKIFVAECVKMLLVKPKSSTSTNQWYKIVCPNIQAPGVECISFNIISWPMYREKYVLDLNGVCRISKDCAKNLSIECMMGSTYELNEESDMSIRLPANPINYTFYSLHIQGGYLKNLPELKSCRRVTIVSCDIIDDRNIVANDATELHVAWIYENKKPFSIIATNAVAVAWGSQVKCNTLTIGDNASVNDDCQLAYYLENLHARRANFELDEYCWVGTGLRGSGLKIFWGQPNENCANNTFKNLGTDTLYEYFSVDVICDEITTNELVNCAGYPWNAKSNVTFKCIDGDIKPNN